MSDGIVVRPYQPLDTLPSGGTAAPSTLAGRVTAPPELAAADAEQQAKMISDIRAKAALTAWGNDGPQ